MSEQENKCMICKKKDANVHLTKIINNQVHKLHLCDACAQAKGVVDPCEFNLSDLLVQAHSIVEQLAKQIQSQALDVSCEHCGFSQIDFKENSQFGCPHCYEQFGPFLKPVLQTIHNKDAVHRGKVPHQLLKRIALTQKLDNLSSRLEAAIKDERYEDAATLRDQIQALTLGEAEGHSQL